MGSFSWWHWVIVLVVVLVLFGGKGKVSDLMGDVAKGIKSFKKGLAEEESPPASPPAARLQNQPSMDPNPDRNLHPMDDDRPHS